MKGYRIIHRRIRGRRIAGKAETLLHRHREIARHKNNPWKGEERKFRVVSSFSETSATGWTEKGAFRDSFSTAETEYLLILGSKTYGYILHRSARGGERNGLRHRRVRAVQVGTTGRTEDRAFRDFFSTT